MPLHGKIVVIKRSGIDGCEFPLTASCLFGRKPDCDIRIQLAQVSKEHCRIDLNENKEVILTNLSSVNPTRVNGEVLQQSERLKHGDVITIIDRSFRFEYPPAPTPKKRRSSTGNKASQEQQVREINTVLTEENKKSDLTSDACLKDGTNTVKLLQKTSEKAEEDGSLDQNKTASPFCELYQMVKKSLDSKTTWKPPGSQPQTPVSRFCTPKPVSAKKARVEEFAVPSDVQSAAKKPETEVSADTPDHEGKSEEEVKSGVTPKSSQKKRESLQVQLAEMNVPAPEEQRPVEDAAVTTPIQGTPKIKRRSSKPRTTPVEETAEIPKTPTRRRSKESAPQPEEPELPTHSVTSSDNHDTVPVESLPSTPKTEPARSLRTSPRTAERKLQVQEGLRALEETAVVVDKEPSSKKRKRSEELATEGKRKSVSFGGHLRPELFDKRMPPDSPLRKGATPRQSLCVAKDKQSLLRRASVIGLIKTPSPGKKSPKAKAKTPSPVKEKSPKTKAKTPSPGKQDTKNSPGRKSLPAAVKTPSPAKSSDTPRSKPNQTATVQGRFSVSRVSTPSPVAGPDSVPQKPVTAAPIVRRKSMKAVKKTPRNTMKSAVEVMRNRRSGVSRASMKVVNSWADIVKFGQTKSQKVVTTKKTIKGITTKKAPVPEPKTPARNHKDQVSTGHADSPVTIFVGKAHKLKAIQPTGGAPKLVYNAALLQKNMKMDEDLTGIAEIFHTPAHSRQRKSVASDQSGLKTPQTTQSTIMIETSVMNTPEETGEMLVSPLNVVSTAKPGIYNSDAVSRLLQDNQESSFIGEVAAEDEAEDSPHSIPALEMPSDDQVSKTEVSTPKQKPEQPDCLTGVKRIMKTPKQRVEPVEDLRGKILKTPKQKPEQPDCLTGVKRIMKTPKQRVEPVEDLRGKLLKTPRAPKGSEEADLDGVKELLATPKHKEEPGEDLPELRDETNAPMVESPPLVCATSIEEAMTDLKDEGVPVEDVKGVTQTSMQELVQEETIPADCVSDLTTEQPQVMCGEDVSVPSDDMKSSSQTDAVDSPKMEDTELATEQPQVVCEEHTEDASVPSEGLQTTSQTDAADPPKMEATEEKVEATNSTSILKITEVTMAETAQDPEPTDNDPPKMEVTEKTELATEDPQVVCEEHTEDVSVPSEDMQTTSQTDAVDPPKIEETELVTEQPQVVCEEHTEDVSVPSEGLQTTSQTDAADPPKMEVTEEKVEATNSTSTLKTTEVTKAETAQDPEPTDNEKELTSEIKEATAPTVLGRGRRGKKTEVIIPTLPNPVRQSGRRRVAQSDLTNDVEAPVETMEVLAPEEKPLPDPGCTSKPKRGRKAKQSSVEQTETVQDNSVEAMSDEVPPAEMAVSLEQTLDVPVERPRRGTKPKQNSTEQTEVVTISADCVSDLTTEQPQVVCGEDVSVPSDDMQSTFQTDAVDPPKMEATELATEQPVSVPSEGMETTSQTDAVDPPKMEVTEEKVEATNSTSTLKTTEVTKAETAQDPEPTEIKEATAPTVLGRGRRAKKTEVIIPTLPNPVRQSGRRRVAQSDLTNDVEAPVETMEVLAPEEKPLPDPGCTSKPKRGRKPKQSSVEQTETVQENSVEAMSDEVPPAEMAVSLEQTRDVPVERPRRGRKPKPNSTEQTEVVPISADCVSDLTTEQPQVVCGEDVSVPSDDMQSTSQTDAVDSPKMEATELAMEQPVSVPSDSMETTSQTDAVDPPKMEVTEEKVEATNSTSTLKTTEVTKAEMVQDPEPTEIKEATAPTVLGRGRRAKKTEVIIPTLPNPVRQSGRRRVAQSDLTNNVEAPVETMEVLAPEEKPLPDPGCTSKPKRGRKAKQSSVEPTETVQENSVEAMSDEVPPAEMAVSLEPTLDVPVERPRRGRKPKPNSTEQTEVVPEETTETVCEKVPAMRARRGRKPQQEAVEKDVEAVETPPIESAASEEASSVPAEKPRRGRKAKPDPVEQAETAEGTIEVPVDEKVEVRAPVVRARRGRKTPQEAVEKEAAPVEIPPIESKEAEVQVPVSKPRRGRINKQDSLEQVEDSRTESAPAEASVAQEPTASPSEKPKRGGRRKLNAVEQVEEEDEAQELAAVVLEKPKRGRKAKPETEAAPAPTDEQDQTCAVATDNPKRGPRAKRDVPAREKEEANAKPGRGRKVIPEEEEQAAPAKRVRRGAAAPTREETTAAEKTLPVAKSMTRRAGKVVSKAGADVPAEAVAAPGKRGTRGAKILRS